MISNVLSNSVKYEQLCCPWCDKSITKSYEKYTIGLNTYAIHNRCNNKRKTIMLSVGTLVYVNNHLLIMKKFRGKQLEITQLSESGTQYIIYGQLINRDDVNVEYSKE